jgi:hypothetical protein
MIGFHDHIYRQGSGRPEPHPSWQAERFTTGTGWLLAAVFFIGAAYDSATWQELSGALPMLLGGVSLATLAYLRHRALERKRAALRKAITRYETILAKPVI